MNKKNKYMKLAQFFSEWSKDPRTKVGAVIIGENGQVLSQGYNGFPRGIKDTEERLNNREIKNKLVTHAEENALYNALLNNANIENSTIYVYGLHVCHNCAKGIIQSGIKDVVMLETKVNDWTESTTLAKEMFEESGVKFEILELSDLYE